MQMTPPEIVLFAGPNGAGKSTFARFALPEAMPFVNAAANPDFWQQIKGDYNHK